MKLSFLSFFCFFYLGLVWGQNIKNTIDTDSKYTTLKAALINCLDCDSYTNPQGLLIQEPGNLIAVTNDGASNLGAVNLIRLEGWFFQNSTLKRQIVPVVLADVYNDEVIPNSLDKPVRFNRYGADITVNGVPVIETPISATQRIWEVSLRPVDPLSDFNAFTVVLNDAELNTFELALQSNAMFPTRLSGSQATTVLAPTDAAFSDLSNLIYGRLDLFRSLIKPPVSSRLNRILNYHLIDSTYWQSGFINNPYVTLNGISVNVVGSTITDSQGRTANIVAFDLKPTNGVIHKLDKVLLPESIPTFATTIEDWNSWQQQQLTTYKTNTQTSGFYNAILANSSATGYTLIAPTTGAGSLTEQRKLLIQGVYFSDDFTNDLVLTSVEGTSTLRFNLYESWYVNGRPLNTDQIDWVTINGAMHVYTGAFAIPSFTQSLWDRIPNAHPFKASLNTFGLQPLLSGPGGFTVLLPDSTTWTNTLDKSEALVKYHVIPQTIFKPHPGNYVTLYGSTVNLNATGFNNIPVLNWDVVSGGCTNGMFVNLQSVLPTPPPLSTTGFTQSTTAVPVSTTEQQVTTVEQVTTAVSTTGRSTTGSEESNAGNTLSFIPAIVYLVALFFILF